MNNALITFLPKKEDANQPGDYRPICLIHSFTKIITKMMAHRLAPELHAMVDINQSAFIQRCSIHDNFMFVRASAKTFKQKKIPKLLLKLDIVKAFNTISWPFILHVLQQRGFGPRWSYWLSPLRSTASTRILLNGETGRPIDVERGLRQRDPILSMVFILAMDVLHRIMTQVAKNGLLQLIGHCLIAHQCSLYADDAILIISPTVQDLVAVTTILEVFGQASSLRTNMSKWTITPIYDPTILALPNCQLPYHLPWDPTVYNPTMEDRS